MSEVSTPEAVAEERRRERLRVRQAERKAKWVQRKAAWEDSTRKALASPNGLYILYMWQAVSLVVGFFLGRLF